MDVNIWALAKDISIKHLLLMLRDDFGSGVFRIIESEPVGDCAIRLANSVQSIVKIYIFTYGQAEGRYGAHIEYPDLRDTAYSDTVDILDDIDYEELRELVEASLDITPLIKSAVRR